MQHNVPIVVKQIDEKMIIVDGQNRFVALTELGKYIPYVLDKLPKPNLGVVEVPFERVSKINIGKNWNTEDHVTSQHKNNVKAATHLLSLCEAYDFKLTLSQAILFGKKLQRSSIIKENYPDYNLEDALYVADLIVSKDLLDKNPVFKSAFFMSELRWYLLFDEFDLKHLVNWIEYNSKTIGSIYTYDEATTLLNRAFDNSRISAPTKSNFTKLRIKVIELKNKYLSK
jgi:hypothetical protein